MNAWDWVRAVAILGPIALMLFAGLFIAVKSGPARPAKTRVPSWIGSFSRTAIQVGGLIVGMATIHILIGQQIPPIW